MCLAQGHKAVTPVRLEPAAPRSHVKHSTTEPLRSISKYCAWKQSVTAIIEMSGLTTINKESVKPVKKRIYNLVTV